MIKSFEYNTVGEAYSDIYLNMISSNPEFIDAGLQGPNYRHWSRDVIIEINEPQSELSLAHVGFNPGRWTKFLNEYFNRADFRKFLLFLYERRHVDAQEYAYICSSHARHSLGNCLFGVTVQTGRYPRVHLVSRSCNFVPTGVLDLSLAACIAQYVSKICGVHHTKVVWTINHLQMTSWPALYFHLSQGLDPETTLDEEIPFQKSMLEVYRWSKVGYLPNLKYMWYARWMSKIKEVDRLRRTHDILQKTIPQIPYSWLPYDDFWVPPTYVDPESPYDIGGANWTTLERLEVKRSRDQIPEENSALVSITEDMLED